MAELSFLLDIIHDLTGDETSPFSPSPSNIYPLTHSHAHWHPTTGCQAQVEPRGGALSAGQTEAVSEKEKETFSAALGGATCVTMVSLKR